MSEKSEERHKREKDDTKKKKSERKKGLRQRLGNKMREEKIGQK